MKINKGSWQRLKNILSNLSMVFTMVKDYKRGNYKRTPWATLIAAASSIFYIILPADFLPDVLPFLGLVDDFAVASFAMAAINSDIEKYKLWKHDEKD